MKWATSILLLLAMSIPSTAAQSAEPETTNLPCKEYVDVMVAQDAVIVAADAEIASLRAALAAKDAEIAELKAAAASLREAGDLYRQMYAAEVEFAHRQEVRGRWKKAFDLLRVGMYGFVGGYVVNEAVK